MTKNSEKSLLEIIREASAKELAEAFSASPEAPPIPEKPESPDDPITINKGDFTKLLAATEESTKEKTLLEIQQLKEILKKSELLNVKLQNKISEDSELHVTRQDYTRRLFHMTCSWIFTVGLFVFLTGFRFKYFNNPTCETNCFFFGLPENVLIAFITSTTATVIGIFVIVARWLFSHPSNNEKDGK